jgi:probable HAF family extracellular repeat protein
MVHPAWLSRVSRNFPALFLSMSLAACGGGGGNNDSSGGSGTSSNPAPSSTQQMQSSGEILAPQPVASASAQPPDTATSGTVPAATSTAPQPTQTAAPAWSIAEVTGLTTGNQIRDMSDAGVIVGVTVDPNETAVHGRIPYQDPFMLKNGQVVSLGSLTPAPASGTTYGAANDINGSGQIVGYSYVSSAGQTHAFLYENGALKDISIGTGGSWAQAINESGQIAIYTNSGTYIYTNGSTRLVPGSDQMFVPVAMNDSGQIAGTQSGAGAATFYDGSKLINLAPLVPKTYSLATGLNNAGQVIGNGYSASGDDYQGFVYAAGAVHLLTAPGSVQSYAESINNAGDVVGSIVNTDKTVWPYLYRNGTMTNLNSLPGVAESGWVLTTASKINNAGQILAAGYLNGQPKRCVLTPPH